MRYSICWIAALLLTPSLFAGSEVPREVVHFEVDHVTTPGQSVFVLGNIPELGNGRMRDAVKMVPGSFDPGPPSSLVWTLDVAIPQGTTYNWRFVLRNDAVSALSDGTNGSNLTTNSSASTTPPTPGTRDLLVYKNNGNSVLEMEIDPVDGDPLVLPFRPVPAHPDLLAARLPDQPFGPGIVGDVNGKALDTPLHSILRRGAQNYNYLSSPGVSNISGNVVQDVLPTATIITTRTIDGVTGRGLQVYLPRGYAEHTTRHYPVLYMHDGQNVFEPGGAFGTWSTEVTAAELIKQAQVRELIIVAIDNSIQRLPEYNPEWSGSNNGDYNSFIANELVPYINANYRTLTGPQHTGIAGSSFGGVASLSLVSDYPNVFGLCGALSTSWWATSFDNAIANGTFPASVRLYIDVGDTNDGADDAIATRDAALRAGRILNDDLYFQIGYGQQHNEAAWSQRIDEALTFLYPITDEANELNLPVPIPGDANADGCVNLSDLAQQLSSFGACTEDSEYDFGSDHDNSGCIDLSDLALVLQQFGQGC